MIQALPVAGSTGATYTAARRPKTSRVIGAPETVRPAMKDANADTPRDGESATGSTETASYGTAQIENFLNRQGDIISDFARSTDVGMEQRVYHLRLAAKEAQFTADVIERLLEQDSQDGGETDG